MKNILITGASSGIGKAVTQLFAKEYDAHLIICGRREDRLMKQKERLESNTNAKVHPLSFDIIDAHQCSSAYHSIPEAMKPIDILINNAGLAKGMAPIHEGELEHWETMIDTNVKGLLYMSRIVAKDMVNASKGHIINTASTAGKEVYPNGNVYCATKHAVDALTKAMRLDLYQHNIRVSQVAPGHVEQTEFAEVRFDGDRERANIYKDFNPLTARDVAETILFIATRPPHVNIQDILMMGTQQADSRSIDKSGRKYDPEY